MFDHSIKVPRLYKTAAKIAKEVTEGKGSIKQLVYECKHPNIKALYALVVHTFQRTDDIEQLLKKSKLLVKEPRFDPWLAKILITELLWGKKHLSSQAKPVKTILAYEQIFRAHLSDVSVNDFQEIQVEKPRYVRVNTLKITVNEAVEGFREEGWILKRYTDDNYLGFLETVTNLGSEEFMIDFHIPYLLIFPPKTQFYQHQAYKDGNIILQDKASCLPVHILNPEPGSTILDMCAAPGMKTTHCASILENKGKIYAVEIGKKRFQTLNKIIETSGASCINAINTDVLTLSDKDCPNIEYILVDPSCSGSGITDRVEIGQQEMEQHKDRLEKLAGFQIKMLRYALTRFPKVKKVVYSTCSIYPEENEDVVRQVLETCLCFKLVPANQFVKNRWENFGSSEFGDIGNYCLYAKPDIDLTSGFFVAVFERLEDGESNQFLNKQLFAQKMQNKKRKRDTQMQDEQNSTIQELESFVQTKKIKTEKGTAREVPNFKMKQDPNEIKQERENPIKKKKIKKDKPIDDENRVIKMKEELLDCKEKKKKIKKEKITDNDSQSICLKHEETHESEVPIKPKKIKKEKIVDDEIQEVQNPEVFKKKTKVKKEKKNNENINMETLKQEKHERTRHETIVEKKKKKKKKHEHKTETSNNGELENSEVIFGEVMDSKSNEGQEDKMHDLTQKQRKKKKEKVRTELETNDLALELVNECVQLSKKKKKKKSKHLGSDDVSVLV